VHSRTKRLLTGTTLALLAVACTAGFGASKAAAASLHTSAKVHKITACGYTATAPGTYELTKSLTDAGSGTCILLAGNSITLYLDSHTITGTGTDTCVGVEASGTSLITKDTVIGGTKAKPSKSATLSACRYGLYVDWTAGTMASYLNIPSPTSEGVFAEYAGGMMLSNINIPVHSASSYGMYLEYGADNVVTKSKVTCGNSCDGFLAYYEVGDTFSHNTAANTNGGNSGTGFYDEDSSGNTWTHNASKGSYYGFYLYADTYGPVTATYNTASGPGTSGSYGFYVYYAFQEADYGSTHHTLISHNKTNGFYYGYYDYSDDAYSVAEKWTNNTADNYTGYGFYIYYPTDYTFTGNIADAHTASKKYDGTSSTYGFYLYEPYSYYPFAKFASNQAYDSEYGFYSDEYMVGGKGNIAKRNKYNSYDVEITG
jgi:hypothetical protein